MASLLLFNPENDLALAANSAYYTPPAAAVRIRTAGALLPMWFARQGDYILAPAGMEPQAEQMRAEYNLYGKIFTPDAVSEIDRCIPWGWSSYAVQTFIKAGINPGILPDSKKIDLWRNLSHRRTSIAILRALSFPDLPVEAFSAEEALLAVESFGGEAYLKFPWSGSGRGVFPVTVSGSSLRSLAESSIRRQGSVIIEPKYDVVTDFAMLFNCEDAEARFHGLSMFKTMAGGAYSGNIIASQSYIAENIGVSPRELEILKRSLEEALTQCVASDYSGPVGIDMMIAVRNGKRIIVPCIEINLRYTMGFVAQAIAQATNPINPSLLHL